MTSFASVLFNTQLKEIKHDRHLSKFRNVMLASLLQHNEHLKGLVGEANIITVAFIQYADVLSISSDTLKYWEEKVKEKQERMNKVPRRVYDIMLQRQWCDGEMVKWYNGEMVKRILNVGMVIF